MEDEPPPEGPGSPATPLPDPALAARERLVAAVARGKEDGPRAFEAICRHVVGDRTYADSTRAVFAELLEQVRATLGRG